MNYWSFYEKFYFIVNILLIFLTLASICFFIYLIIRYKRMALNANCVTFGKVLWWRWCILPLILVLMLILGIGDLVIDIFMVSQYSNSYLVGVTVHNWLLLANCCLLVIYLILCYLFFYNKKQKNELLLTE